MSFLPTVVVFRHFLWKVTVHGLPDVPLVGVLRGDLWQMDNDGQGPGSTLVAPLFSGVFLNDTMMEVFVGNVSGT